MLADATAWLDVGIVVTTFLVVFPAELPDKSFVATLVLATRYGRLAVWVGAAAAFAVQVVIAVVAGQLLTLLPEAVVLAVTAALFALGAVALVRGGLVARADEQAAEESEAEQIRAETSADTSPLRAALTTFAILFAAEWGDLTQLLTAGLAARSGSPVSVALGSWLALSGVAGIGVLVGSWLTGHVPLWRMRLIAGAILAVLAVLTVTQLVRVLRG